MFEFIKNLFRFKKAEVAVIEEPVKKVVKRVKKVADVNNDNVVNLEDVKEIKKRVTKKVKEVVDVNKDGKVNVEDAKAVKKRAYKKPSQSSTIKKESQEPINTVQQPVSSKKRGRKPKAK